MPLSGFLSPFTWDYLLGSLSVGGGGVGWGSYGKINEHQKERMKKSLIFFIKTPFTSNVFAVEYSEPCETSMMETFAKIVNGFKPLIVFKRKVIKNTDAEQG